EAVKWLGACADIEDQKLLATEKELQARQKSFFLNALGHDLRAPLHNVLLNAQLLKMSADSNGGADRNGVEAESVDMIVENAICDGKLTLRVSDTGIGIPQENVPYLFDEFYQVNNYERDRSKGFGMGLAICKSLARHIGGEVRLAGTGPEGSCFEVTCKRVRADRGGRPDGEPGDRGDPVESGLCRV